MEIIFEIIITLIIEVFFQIISETLLFFGYETIRSPFKEHKSINKYSAIFGCILIGSIIGLISYFIYPKPIINNDTIPGISLIISPIIIGFIMKKWGEVRIESSKRISILLTFWGGASFAFGYSLVRFLLIK